MSDRLSAIGGRVAAAADRVRLAGNDAAACRDLPWVSPAAAGFATALDDELWRLAGLARRIDALVDELRAAGATVWPSERKARLRALAGSGRTGRMVTGGAGAAFVSVDPEALAAAADRLTSARRHADEAGEELAAVRWTPMNPWQTGGATAELPPGFRDRLYDLLSSPWAPVHRADRLRELATSVHSAAVEHVGLERRLVALLHGIGTVVEAGPGRSDGTAGTLLRILAGVRSATVAPMPAVGGEEPLSVLRGYADGTVQRWRDAGSTLVDDLTQTGAVEALVAALGTSVRAAHPETLLAGGPPAAAVAAAVAGLLRALEGNVRLVPVVDPPQLPAPDGLGGLVGIVARSDDRTGPAGTDAAPAATVTLQRLDHPDGTTTWVVAIPGTQTMGMLGDVPTDMATNAELMAGAVDPMSVGVLRAMDAVGVGPEDRVVLAGHSQGGMVAMSVAALAAGSYRVAGVLTAGSPNIPRQVPSSVPVVRVQHRQDAVPQTDGAPTPVGTHASVVEWNLDAEHAVTSGEAHDVHTYARTVRELDERLAADPGSLPDGDAIVGALGGEGTTATTFQFQVTRGEVPLRQRTSVTAAP